MAAFSIFYRLIQDLFFRLAALAARFSFKLSTASFLTEFFEGDFSFAMVSGFYNKL